MISCDFTPPCDILLPTEIASMMPYGFNISKFQISLKLNVFLVYCSFIGIDGCLCEWKDGCIHRNTDVHLHTNVYIT